MTIKKLYGLFLVLLLPACSGTDEVPTHEQENFPDRGDSASEVQETVPTGSISLMNWNILVNNEEQTSSVIVDGTTYTYTADYPTWGGAAPVAPRAAAMNQALATMTEKPAFIAIMEMDPSWKAEENFAALASQGYKMLYPNTPFMLTQLLYRPERLTLLSKGYINLSIHQGGIAAAMKTAVTYGVFQEKGTNEIFIGLATHWEPNGGTNMDNGISGAINNIYYCENVRLEQAREAIALLEQLRTRYPSAHFFFGGDLNTVDFELLWMAAAEILAPYDTSGFDINSLLLFAGSSERAADDFNGAIAYFEENSGLLGSRHEARRLGLAFDDLATTKDADAISDFLGKDLATPIVIDYNFFSPEMALESYTVLDQEPFYSVSDHLPILLKLTYKINNNNEILLSTSYPDDSGTDLYLPIADYQGKTIVYPTDQE